MPEKNIFKRIIDREIEAEILFEDDRCLVFRDIMPQAPVHLLVIPKKEIPSSNEIAEEDAELIGHLFLTIRRIAEEQGVAESGYRVVLNCGPDATQTVRHLHFHLIGGRSMSWPPG
ncbi:MAG TPA: histidine triad nucleotide-binding protein [Planctomycetaceae bacterium]|nr:histidine triad nucleotide-binding protein [Planctomycetaceae bacterium]